MMTNKILTEPVHARRPCLAAALVLLLCCGSLSAREGMHEVEVTEQGGVFQIKASVVVDAAADYVRRVLSDFVHIYRLNSSIIESEVLASDHQSVT